ncbi:MAG: hypothetical protein ACRDKY_13120 [Solirubrobacteraceae bacterium]
MTAAVIALSQAWTDSIGLLFSFGILMGGLAVGLVVVAMVSARGEKAEDEKLAGRWGRRAQRSED